MKQKVKRALECGFAIIGFCFTFFAILLTVAEKLELLDDTYNDDDYYYY